MMKTISLLLIGILLMCVFAGCSDEDDSEIKDSAVGAYDSPVKAVTALCEAVYIERDEDEAAEIACAMFNTLEKLDVINKQGCRGICDYTADHQIHEFFQPFNYTCIYENITLKKTLKSNEYDELDFDLKAFLTKSGIVADIEGIEVEADLIDEVIEGCAIVEFDLNVYKNGECIKTKCKCRTMKLDGKWYVVCYDY